MEPEQQRIAIAEACGWKRISIPLCGKRWASPESQKSPFYYAALPDCSPLPDYPNDLNAMHEAEKGLRTPTGNVSDSMAADRMHTYAELLGYAIDATAPQRAEAFLRTIGKWVGP